MAQKDTIQPIRKPILKGGWHGASAVKLGLKRMLSLLVTSILFLAGTLMLSFDALWAKIMILIVLVGIAFYFHYTSGLGDGERDCAWGEGLWSRKEKGETLKPDELDRSFHPLKGYCAVLIGAVPFLILCVFLAVTAKRITYTLGVLPSWTQSLMTQSEFADGLAYYNVSTSVSLIDIVRIVVRACLMPFINVAVAYGNDVALLAERFSPLLILIAPMGYGVGYAQGLKVREKVNTSIRIGTLKKQKKLRKEHKARMAQQNKKPEQLI